MRYKYQQLSYDECQQRLKYIKKKGDQTNHQKNNSVKTNGHFNTTMCLRDTLSHDTNHEITTSFSCSKKKNTNRIHLFDKTLTFRQLSTVIVIQTHYENDQQKTRKTLVISTANHMRNKYN